MMNMNDTSSLYPKYTYSFGTITVSPSLVERGELQHIGTRSGFLCGGQDGWDGGTFATTNCLGCLLAYEPRPWWKRAWKRA